MIGQIGTLLGSNDINIANFALGRGLNREAVGVVNVDNWVSDELLRKICHCPSIRFARIIQL